MRFWKWLIAPAFTQQPLAVRRKSRLLAAMLAIFIAAGTISEVLYRVVFSEDYKGGWLAVPAILSLVLAAVLNRFGRAALAAWITTSIFILAVFALTFFSGMPVDLDFLNFLIFPILLASVFLSGTISLVLSLFIFMGILLTPALFPGTALVADSLNPAFFVLITGVVIYVNARHLKGLETDRQQNLAEKEELYRSLFEGANDAIFLVNTDHIHVAANQKAADLLGYTVDELVGKPVSEVVVPQEFYLSKQTREAVLMGENLSTYERTFLKKSGAEFPAEVNSTLIRSRDGKPLFLQGIVRDISARKETEARIQRQLERLKGLREIDRRINSSTDLAVTLEVILTQARSQLEISGAQILLFNPHLLQLEHCVDQGLDGAGLVQSGFEQLVGLDDPLAGMAVARQSTIRILDLHQAAATCPRLAALDRQGFTAAVAVPLIARGYVKGVLEVFQRASFDPSTEWVEFLETLGGQAAIAIQSTNLFQDLQRKNMDLERAYDATLEGWAKALELRDKETEGHSQRVTKMTMELGRSLGISGSDLVHLRRGALLHDIGKMGIPDNILLKPGPLTADEWVIMKMHAQYSYDLLSSVPYLGPAIDIPYCHHEKWDGSGYPRGLQGEQIPLAARIFAIVDVWDALSSDRPYRPAWPQDKIIAYIQEQNGIHFDPQITGLFLSRFSNS